jgi:hypothetical protein
VQAKFDHFIDRYNHERPHQALDMKYPAELRMDAMSACASRYLLTCEALSTTQEVYAFTVFERAFKEFGLPRR